MKFTNQLQQDSQEIIQFLKTGKRPSCFLPIKVDKSSFIEKRKDYENDGRIVLEEESHYPLYDGRIVLEESRTRGNRYALIIGAVLKTRRLLPIHKGMKNIMLVNGDDNVTHLDMSSRIEFPTISFRCLERFFVENPSPFCHSKTLMNVLKRLVVLDYTKESTLALSEMDQIAVLSKSEPKPRVGYTLMTKPVSEGKYWHRPATVVLYDPKQNMTLLFGQDEGTYFGCELDLPKKPYNFTVRDAIISLIPKPIRNRRFQRQGEWFMVEEKAPPSRDECVLESDTSTNIVLGRESEDSHMHHLHSVNLRVRNDGRVFAWFPTLKHEEHATLTGKNWCSFWKNTARQSYSEEGVD